MAYEHKGRFSKADDVLRYVTLRHDDALNKWRHISDFSQRTTYKIAQKAASHHAGYVEAHCSVDKGQTLSLVNCQGPSMGRRMASTDVTAVTFYVTGNRIDRNAGSLTAVCTRRI